MKKSEVKKFMGEHNMNSGPMRKRTPNHVLELRKGTDGKVIQITTLNDDLRQFKPADPAKDNGKPYAEPGEVDHEVIDSALRLIGERIAQVADAIKVLDTAFDAWDADPEETYMRITHLIERNDDFVQIGDAWETYANIRKMALLGLKVGRVKRSRETGERAKKSTNYGSVNFS